MKNSYILITIYAVALALSIYGYIIDTDPIMSGFAYQMFEIFMLSVVVFGILALPFYTFYFLFRFLKRIMAKH